MSDSALTAVTTRAQSVRTWRSEPTAREAVCLAAVVYILGFVVISLVEPFSERVRLFGDTVFYVGVVKAIRTWDFSTLTPWHFWGLPYAAAAISVVTSLSEWWSVLVVSLASALGATYLMQKLFGGWVACFFVLASLEWQQRALLGGSEPPFMLLILGAFWAARTSRWAWASLFAALATTVRPLGIFLLAAIAIALILKRDYRQVITAVTIGVAVGVLYVLPLIVYYGDPLANFRFYQRNDWAGSSPFGLPFVAMARGALSVDMPWTSRIREGLWVAFYVLAVGAMFRTRFREYARRYPVEVSFTGFYLLFLFSYNSPFWSWVEFARYALPAFPVALYAVENYLPKDRRVLWILAPVTATFSAMSAMNARRVALIVRALFR